MFNEIVRFIQELYKTDDFIPLHAPVFLGNEKKYLNDCIDSTFVSSVGKYVDKFENQIQEYTGSTRAVVCINGTNALHLAMLLAGVEENDEVITQSLTFVATCNAISYIGAKPVFLDVDKDTLGLSPFALKSWLSLNTIMKGELCYNIKTGKRVKACIPMHTFGHPARIDEILKVCEEYNLELIEDAAESIGSFYKGKHTGTFGRIGVLSFNGNKTITTGGGGMLLFNDKDLGDYAKHISTQAKVPHKWEFVHDQIGYNYRMPNINAAIGCAQMENLDSIIANKREIASRYIDFFERIKDVDFVKEPVNSKSNYWLNAVLLTNKKEKEAFLEYTNNNGIMTRPVWQLMSRLEMFKNCQTDTLENSIWIEERLVNIPSSVRIKQ